MSSSSAVGAETTSAFASVVLGVPAYAAANKLKNIYDIKVYGKDSVISCCVPENAVQPGTVGCVRRCTLALPGYEGKLLREKLVDMSTATRGERADLCRTTVVLDFLACGPGSEESRSPFSHGLGESAVASAQTVVSVSEVTSSVNRCAVTLETTVRFAFPSDAAAGAGVDEDERHARRCFVREVRKFWQMYLEHVAAALEKTVLLEAYPALPSDADTVHIAAFEAAEETFCVWSGSQGENMKRAEVVETMESVLVAWAHLLKDYKHCRLSGETARDDAAGSRRVAEETARMLASATAAAAKYERELRYLRDTDAREKDRAEMAETISVLESTLRNQQRARELLIEQHRREYSTANYGSRRRNQPQAEAEAAKAVPSSTLPWLTPRTCEQCDEAPAEGAGEGSAQPKYAAPPVYFDRRMLTDLFDAEGGLNEPQAQRIFDTLIEMPTSAVSAPELEEFIAETEGAADGGAAAARAPASAKKSRRKDDADDGLGEKGDGSGHYVTVPEVQAVLLAMDPQGRFEDIDGTQQQLAKWRAAMQSSFAERYGTAASADSKKGPRGGAAGGSGSAAAERTRYVPRMSSNNAWGATSGAGDADEAGNGGDASQQMPMSALAKSIDRHDAAVAAQRVRAMEKLAEDAITRYAFREAGKLYFDEFCLALMHLLK